MLTFSYEIAEDLCRYFFDIRPKIHVIKINKKRPNIPVRLSGSYWVRTSDPPDVNRDAPNQRS
jgi:hypothetical protein